MGIVEQSNVRISGHGETSMVLAHGYGCDQNMWRWVAPAFEDRFRVVRYDLIGAGQSDLAAYDPAKYAVLDGYADDLVAICRALGVEDGVFVGHSVSSMIGLLAARRAPELFGKLVMIGPSPRYIDDGDYRGGFTAPQIEEMLAFLDRNYMGWSATMAPAIMGNPERPELADELTNSFCRTDPEIAKRFARATFTGDNRDDLEAVDIPVLVLQCSDDVIAPDYVGEYVRSRIKQARLVKLAATGHCPNLSAPDETIAAIAGFV